MKLKNITIIFFVMLIKSALFCQNYNNILWSNLHDKYYTFSYNSISYTQIEDTLTNTKIILDSNTLNKNNIFDIEGISFSTDESKILIFYNAKKNWRYKTIGNYVVYNINDNSFYFLGSNNNNSLMFAKFSPDNNNVAYVSENNIYVEKLQNKQIIKLTSSGTASKFNGVFDWSYEEEFKCYDGFKWSFDSKHIAYWYIDASNIKDYTLVNYTDSIYPTFLSFPYPKVNYEVPKVKIAVVDINNKNTSWVNLGIVGNDYFIPKIDWYNKELKLIIQKLDRSQTKSKLYKYNYITKKADLLYVEKDSVWIDVYNEKKITDKNKWDWINDSCFLWLSEKGDYRQIYLISTNGDETLITKDNFDVIDIVNIDLKNQIVYFLASPNNATQKYLYKKFIYKDSQSELVTPTNFNGTNNYNFSPLSKYSIHSFTNYYTPLIESIIKVDSHLSLTNNKEINLYLDSCFNTKLRTKIQYIQIPYPEQNTYLDAWVVFPDSFNKIKKYPVLFYVYGEPASQVVVDAYKSQRNLTNNDLKSDYIYIGVDNRGCPAPKGKKWRKDIYKKIGIVNVEDQVYAANKIKKWDYIDSTKIGVWGWSGGGSLSLNLILQHPEIYKTAISIAPVTDLKLYDNIYEERYMGLLDDNKDNYIKGSPINYAKNLKGNLLLIHGTGDDNVHFQNFEVMVNEFIKFNKKFSSMIYPNRTHGIYEGENTRLHLKTIFTDFLNKNLIENK